MLESGWAAACCPAPCLHHAPIQLPCPLAFAVCALTGKNSGCYRKLWISFGTADTKAVHVLLLLLPDFLHVISSLSALRLTNVLRTDCPVHLSLFSTTFQSWNNIFLAQHFSISININQISA
jgi:hypothetical protein